MKIVFLIGGIGSGKSSVAHLFADKGVPVLDLDKVGHEVLSQSDLVDSLVVSFGEEILTSRGSIDRTKLASVAFASPETAATLAELTQPAILDELKKWLAEQEAQESHMAVIEASAYDNSQTSYSDRIDCIILVSATPDLQIARAIAKGFAADDVERRISNQPSDDERRQWVDYEIRNDGTMENLVTQFDILWNKLYD